MDPQLNLHASSERFSALPGTQHDLPCGTRHAHRRCVPAASAASQTRPDAAITCPSANEQLFEELFLSSRRKFMSLAYSILQNREDAEDALQDACMCAHRNLRNFEGRSAFTTWFRRIVTNAALMALRKRKALRLDDGPQITEAADNPPWIETLPGIQPDPETIYRQGEVKQIVNSLIGRLSPTLEEAFVLAHYDELSNQEASQALDVKLTTFKWRVQHARRQIRRRLHRLLHQRPANRTNCQRLRRDQRAQRG